MSSIGEGSLSAGTDENNGLVQREEQRTSPPTIDPKKYMAEHSGKDILSSDVEIKGSIKFQKELLIDGKVEGEINSDGVLMIKGYYPTTPNRIIFQLKYLQEEDEWKLVGIDVNLKE